MSLRSIARKLPARFREKLLAENVIYKAVPAAHDGHMKVLFGLWRTYIDPNGTGDLSCPFCVQNVLTSFRELEKELIQMAKEEALLDEL